MQKNKRNVQASVGIIILLMVGLVYAWSVMSKSISAAHPEWTSAQLSLTYTLIMTFLCVGSLAVGFLPKRIKPRTYIVVSSVFMLCGLFLASMTKESPIPLYLGMGVLCGTATGLAYNTVLATASKWFPGRHGQISGILLMGFGLSSFIIGKIFAAVTPSDGSNAWCVTFRVLGVILFAVLLVCSFLLKNPESNEISQEKIRTKSEPNPVSSVHFTAAEMIRMPVFWLAYAWIILISAAGLILIAHASGIAGQIGSSISDNQIATAVGMISIMNGIGRVISGSIYDRKGYRLTMLLPMVYFIAAALILIPALRCDSFILIVIGFLVGGYAYGSTASMPPAIVGDFWGKKHYSLNFSIYLTNLIIASFASTLAGRLYDISHTYMTTVYLMIAVTVCGFVIFLFIRKPKRD
ncbi:MAG: MFS transporter [Lachnospiraceae bacterium]|nr:MFS transporter [Lachnospiraceae bacterium]